MPPGGMPAPPAPPLPGPASPLPVGVPVGTVVAFAGEVYGQAGAAAGAPNIAPEGWLVCDGRQLHRAAFPELFAAIGYRYLLEGEAAGVLFRVPDLQGYFLRGVDPTNKVDKDGGTRKTPAGAAATSPFVGSIQRSALLAHEHHYNEPQRAGTTPGEGAPVNMIQVAQAETTDLLPATLDGADTTSKTETRAVNVAVYYLIKFTGGVWPWTAPLGGAWRR